MQQLEIRFLNRFRRGNKRIEKIAGISIENPQAIQPVDFVAYWIAWQSSTQPLVLRKIDDRERALREKLQVLQICKG